MSNGMKIVTDNRKASFDYFLQDRYEAGIVLTGTEIKSIRKGSANLKDTYARIKNDEVFIINMYQQRKPYIIQSLKTKQYDILHQNNCKSLSMYIVKQEDNEHMRLCKCFCFR